MQAIANNFRISHLSNISADVTFDEDFNLKISSKKLPSGKCQVKFSAMVREQKDLYGYVLVDSTLTLREVILSIREKLWTIRETKDFHHLHLYSIGKTERDALNFIIFD